MVGRRVIPLSRSPKAREEKISVTVRVRPLNQKEEAVNDCIAWDCTDEHTIIFNNPNQERPTVQTEYVFDKVFGPTCSNLKVYEEGARDVALSVLTWINATIIAYGQTSSGKTFTMRGISENIIKDIYEYINTTPERDFVLKVSALEIYNETVVDLLNRGSGSLRLLDDPEKGTVAEKLVEEVVKDSQHLSRLFCICEAQRQEGETALNDKSSRSHQIIRLTIESSLRDNSGCEKSFIACLNLVDLAGNERASLTNADGTRLKEGSHINRSLLTLTKVIRKLSGKRNGHIPYRDSKLTRILQPSLGGNARTAIVCTVVSKKTRELRSGEPSSSACFRTLLLEKDFKIQQMEKEIAMLKWERDYAQSELEAERKFNIQMEKEMAMLKQERDHAQSELEAERKPCKEHEGCHQVAKCSSFPDENESFSGRPTPKAKQRILVGRQAMLRRSATSTDRSMLVHEIQKLEQQQKQLGVEANQALEALYKEVVSHILGSAGTAESIDKPLSEIKDMQVVRSIPEDIVLKDKANLKEEIARLNSQGSAIESLGTRLDNEKSIDKLLFSFPTNEETPEPKTPLKKNKAFASSNKGNMPNLRCSPYSTLACSRKMECENRAPEHIVSSGEAVSGLHKAATPRIDKDGNCISREDIPVSRRPNSGNVKKMEMMFKNAIEGYMQTIRAYVAYVTELKEREAKVQYKKELLIGRVYMEVELRRLTWWEQQLAELGNASPALLGDDPPSAIASSVKALKQERKYLAERVSSKLTEEEREMLYIKWEIPAGGKQRRLQLVNKLWTDPKNIKHAEESAEVVAKLAGLGESGDHVCKEMFELKFVSQSDTKPWMGWNLIKSHLFHL